MAKLIRLPILAVFSHLSYIPHMSRWSLYCRHYWRNIRKMIFHHYVKFNSYSNCTNGALFTHRFRQWNINRYSNIFIQENALRNVVCERRPSCLSLNVLTCEHIEAETKLLPFSRQHFQWHFLEWKLWISLKISLEYVATVWIDDISSLDPIMAWRRPSNKTLSEPMMFSLPMMLS